MSYCIFTYVVHLLDPLPLLLRPSLLCHLLHSPLPSSQSPICSHNNNWSHYWFFIANFMIRCSLSPFERNKSSFSLLLQWSETKDQRPQPLLLAIQSGRRVQRSTGTDSPLARIYIRNMVYSCLIKLEKKEKNIDFHQDSLDFNPYSMTKVGVKFNLKRADISLERS